MRGLRAAVGLLTRVPVGTGRFEAASVRPLAALCRGGDWLGCCRGFRIPGRRWCRVWPRPPWP